MAGVSLNAIIGDNGIITNAQLAKVETDFSGYKEELETNLVTSISDGKIEKEDEVTLLGENVRKYIPSLKEVDIGKFVIISGKLYYMGNDELEKKAALSQKMKIALEIGSEEEIEEKVEELAVDSVLKNAGEKAFNYKDKNGESHEGGIKLYDKSLVNATKWKVVTEVEEGKLKETYGTGWSYIPEGTEVENLGKIKYSYIGNYQTGEMIKFNGEIHSLMGYDSSMAVTDHLIFNADPGVMDEYNSLSEEDRKTFDISKLGEGIKFHGYDDENKNLDLSQAFTKTSFIFDGENDYLELTYNNETKFEDGFCLEFYGKIKGPGKHWNIMTKKEEENVNPYYMGFLNIGKGNLEENYQLYKFFRFGLSTNDNGVRGLIFNIGALDWMSELTSPDVEIGWSERRYSLEPRCFYEC